MKDRLTVYAHATIVTPYPAGALVCVGNAVGGRWRGGRGSDTTAALNNEQVKGCILK